MRTEIAVGFFWSSSDDNPRPDAWCAECHERLIAAGGDWTEALRKAAGRRGRARAARIKKEVLPVQNRKAVLAAALARKRR